MPEADSGVEPPAQIFDLADALRVGAELAAKGELEKARLHYLDVLVLAPDEAIGWECLGQTLVDLGRFGEGAQALTRAAELDPNSIGCRSALGFLYRNMSIPEAAIHWHGEALALQPNSLILQLNHAFVLPLVATSPEQVNELRGRCLDRLLAIEKNLSTAYFPGVMTCHPYYLIYHNHDDRALLEAYGRLMVRFFGDQAADQQSLKDLSSIKAERVRVGFLSGFFYGHSHLQAFEGLIRHLNREFIDVVLIHLADAQHDNDSERLEATCQQVVRLSTPHDEASAELRALGLDVLFFTDIGMHPRITRLASRRHAPLQITGWEVPQTSGLPTIDAYISSDLAEPDEAQDYYSEELIRLPGLPCCYLSDAIIDNEYSRDYFFLPPGEVLLGCLQSLEKIHPDFDALLERLAHRAPEAWFVFVESSTTSHMEIFLDRLARSAPSVSARLILLGRMTREEYIGLSGCVDLLLDTIYFGSGVTLFETIYSGTPIVTLEGRFLRSRLVFAAYKQIGVSSPPIARTLDEYVELAAQLVGDSNIRTSLRVEIREKARANLYDRMEFVRGFENFVLESIGRRVQENPCG